jgi:hypothetical protein
LEAKKLPPLLDCRQPRALELLKPVKYTTLLDDSLERTITCRYASGYRIIKVARPSLLRLTSSRRPYKVFIICSDDVCSQVYTPSREAEQGACSALDVEDRI